MPRFTSMPMFRFSGLPQRTLFRVTVLAATAVVMVPHGSYAQDNGKGTINFAMPSAASAQTSASSENPYDVGQEGVVPAEAPAENVQKHWTQMSYAELKAELARQDTNYSVKLRAEMEARLKTLEDAALGGGAAASGAVPPVTPEASAVNPAAATNAQPAAPAVVVMPPADTTPWWKKPKSERAAAKEAARARDAAVSGNSAQEPRELTPREQIYQQIQNNRGR